MAAIWATLKKGWDTPESLAIFFLFALNNGLD